jgi:Heterokaryon incompatibility protein (HET)
MYLLDTSTLELREFFEPNIPDYAILSHRWENGEVLYSDVRNGVAASKPGFFKVQGCCDLARNAGFDYVWIDTCCINKSSSAELSEAINSMFRWYEKSQVCYAYFSDVTDRMNNNRTVEFSNSKWFTRGWTLQELLAPPMIVFYDRDWTEIGTRRSLQTVIKGVTKINCDLTKWRRASIAQKMSWVARRQTSRIEDMAYCLLGLFGVYMTVLYGEGRNAFLRLQLEIINKSDDESIFAWKDAGVHWMGTSTSGLLAHSPASFMGSEDIVPGVLTNKRPEYTMTSRGLKLEHLTVLKATQNTLRIMLNCSKTGSTRSHLGIHLARVDGEQYQRTRCSELVFWDHDLVGDQFRCSDIAVFVKQPEPSPSLRHENITFLIDVASVLQHGFEIVLVEDYKLQEGFPLLRASRGLFVLKPAMVDGLVQDQVGAIFHYHDRVGDDTFAIVVDSMDKQVGVNVLLARGNRFGEGREGAFTKFASLFCDRGGSALGYEPLDQRRLDRVSRVLGSGRSVSCSLSSGRAEGKQCYLVQVTIRGLGESLPWPDPEGEQYVITDELYEEFLRTGISNEEGGDYPASRQCSWDRARRSAARKLTRKEQRYEILSQNHAYRM